MNISTKFLVSVCSLYLLHMLGFLAAVQAQERFAKQRSALPVSLAASAIEFGPSQVAISPDEQFIAYVLSDPKKTPPRRRSSGEPTPRFTKTGAPINCFGCDVWTVNIQSGESRNLSNGQGVSWHPVWSPNGKLLAFYSDRNGRATVWIWERESGHLRPLSNELIRGWEPVLWMNDSRRVIVRLLPEGVSFVGGSDEVGNPSQKATKPAATFRHYSSDETNLSDSQSRGLALKWQLSGDIAVLNVADGRIKRLTSGLTPINCSLSPANTDLVFINPKQRETPYSFETRYDLMRLSLGNGALHTLTELSSTLPIFHIDWSPDGKELVYPSARDLYVVSAGGGPARRLSRPPNIRFDYYPFWEPAGQAIYVTGAGSLWRVPVSGGPPTAILGDAQRTVLALSSVDGPNRTAFLIGARSSTTKQESVYTLNAATGEITKLIEGDQIHVWSISAISRSGNCAIVVQSADRPEDLWFGGAHGIRQITHTHPALENYSLGKSRLIEYKGANGQTLRGALLLPSDYKEGQRYPLIVKVYGGAMLSDYVNSWAFYPYHTVNMQIFATRGYAILLPDMPLRVGFPMEDIATTVLAGVDKTVELGIADPERLAVMGASYGGYSTLALLVQTSRFKAACMDAGFGSLLTNYGLMLRDGSPVHTTWAESGQGRMGGTPWEFRDRYINNSPIFFLDRVQTPVLIIQGALDVGTQNADEIFVSLRRLGKHVEYVSYEGDGHGIDSNANKIDYWTRLITWFDKNLNRASSSDGIKPKER